MEKETNQRLKTRNGWRHQMKEKMTPYNFNKNTPRISIVPWCSPIIEVTQVELEKKKNEYTEEELRRRTEEKVAELDADIEIYTDGSTSGC